ncbi:hypothetical protein QUB78_01780 [Microcoleus sp. ARI1-A4]|uniref:hypothetical protein n=1 Tax=unclassified Microcoleus TaxID=2642155 RepID=UPI002FCF840E
MLALPAIFRPLYFLGRSRPSARNTEGKAKVSIFLVFEIDSPGRAGGHTIFDFRIEALKIGE